MILPMILQAACISRIKGTESHLLWLFSRLNDPAASDKLNLATCSHSTRHPDHSIDQPLHDLVVPRVDIIIVVRAVRASCLCSSCGTAPRRLWTELSALCSHWLRKHLPAFPPKQSNKSHRGEITSFLSGLHTDFQSQNGSRWMFWLPG